MNYFAHGYRFVDDPYFTVGTAIPDWMHVVDRRARIRPRQAEAFVDDPTPPVASIARGIAQHYHDDAWFHRTEAFAQLSWQFTAAVRDALGDDRSMRPSFLGHILVELLLDAVLIADNPARLDAYYNAVLAVDPTLVVSTVDRLAKRSLAAWGHWIEAFATERFLADYADDRRLLRRLNQVMHRVGLEPLDDALLGVLPEAREQVRRRKDELLTPDDSGRSV